MRLYGDATGNCHLNGHPMDCRPKVEKTEFEFLKECCANKSGVGSTHLTSHLLDHAKHCQPGRCSRNECVGSSGCSSTCAPLHNRISVLSVTESLSPSVCRVAVDRGEVWNVGQFVLLNFPAIVDRLSVYRHLAFHVDIQPLKPDPCSERCTWWSTYVFAARKGLLNLPSGHYLTISELCTQLRNQGPTLSFRNEGLLFLDQSTGFGGPTQTFLRLVDLPEYLDWRRFDLYAVVYTLGKHDGGWQVSPSARLDFVPQCDSCESCD